MEMQRPRRLLIHYRTEEVKGDRKDPTASIRHVTEQLLEQFF